MAAALTAVRVIDTDSHVTEPADLWTSRVSKKWRDDVPHVRFDERTQEDRWFIGGEASAPWGMMASVGWPELFPSYPRTTDEANPGAFDPHARLKKLDENGIHAQLIYPNLVGFFAGKFMQLGPELALECTRAYNDFLTDFCSADPNRLVPLTALPFWDVDAAVKEIERCQNNGHKGVLFAHTLSHIGLPDIYDDHWSPVLEAAQTLEQSVNFHVGFAAAASTELKDIFADLKSIPRVVSAEQGVFGFMSNARAIAMLTLRGVCHRFPRLKFVCVESGFGWVPFVLQALDWQWSNMRIGDEYPGRLLPSEYFDRQIYATMWFEQPSVGQLERWQDNLMWETDYPHFTAQWPTPTSDVALPAAQAIESTLGTIDDSIRRKILHDNAARLYHLA